MGKQPIEDIRRDMLNRIYEIQLFGSHDSYSYIKRKEEDMKNQMSNTLFNNLNNR